jgi:hypothetical protein
MEGLRDIVRLRGGIEVLSDEIQMKLLRYHPSPVSVVSNTSD